jgi:hypothetical protein
MDELAERRVLRDTAEAHAPVKHLLEPERTDDVLHLDVEVVGRERQTRNEPGLDNHARRERVGLFRLEVRIAAEQALVLGRRVRRDVAVLRRSNAGWGKAERALLGRRLRNARRKVVSARIDAAGQTERLREEQLDDVRRANRPVVASTEPDILDRGEVRLDLPTAQFFGPSADERARLFLKGELPWTLE